MVSLVKIELVDVVISVPLIATPEVGSCSFAPLHLSVSPWASSRSCALVTVGFNWGGPKKVELSRSCARTPWRADCVTETGCPVMMSTQPDSTGAYATAGWEDQWEAVPTKNRWPGGLCGCGRPP